MEQREKERRVEGNQHRGKSGKENNERRRAFFTFLSFSRILPQTKGKRARFFSHTPGYALIGSMSASGTPPSSVSALESGGNPAATAPPAPLNGQPIAHSVDDAAAAASAGLPPLSDQAVPLMEGLLYRESTLVPMAAKRRYGVLYA